MRKYIYLILLLLFCNFGCTDSKICDNVTALPNSVAMSRSSDTSQRLFKFPIKPGSAQWMSFETHQQKIDACRIPDNLLPLLSTEELVEICMEYPLLIDAYAYNNIVEGMQQVASAFNGFQELFKRKDNCICLFDYLRSNDLRQKNTFGLDEINLAKKTIYYALAEVLLSFDRIIQNADDDQKKHIALFSCDLMESQEQKPSVYGLSSIGASAYLAGSVIAKKKSVTRSGNVLSDFLNRKMILNNEELQELKNVYKNSINNW